MEKNTEKHNAKELRHIFEHDFTAHLLTPTQQMAWGLRRGAPSRFRKGYGATLHICEWWIPFPLTLEKSRMWTMWMKDSETTERTKQNSCQLHMFHNVSKRRPGTHSKIAAKAARVDRSAWENLGKSAMGSQIPAIHSTIQPTIQSSYPSKEFRRFSHSKISATRL